MCKAKEVLLCPNCKSRLEATRPDSAHPLYSLDKPPKNEVDGGVIEQVYSCKNPRCNAQVTVYWYETKLSLDNE
jgi:hypothetical protein